MEAAGWVGLMPGAGKKQCAVEAGVEGALLGEGCAFDLDGAEVRVPFGLSGVAELREGLRADLGAQVVLGLLEGDEGGGDPCLEGLGVAVKVSVARVLFPAWSILQAVQGWENSTT